MGRDNVPEAMAGESAWVKSAVTMTLPCRNLHDLMKGALVLTTEWPGAFVSTFANDGAGRVVFDRGDMVFPFHRYFNDQVELDIQGGFIRRITGGYKADLPRAHMERYQSPDVYALSHLGWGLSRDARWEALGQCPSNTIEGQDGRAFAGNFLFPTGPNAGGGGNRKTPCHTDTPMRGCAIRLDGTPVVIDGALVAA